MQRERVGANGAPLIRDRQIHRAIPVLQRIASFRFVLRPG